MKLIQTKPRYPALEPVHGDLVRLKLLWAICSASPLFYLWLGHLLASHWFHADKPGLLSLSPDRLDSITGAATVLAFLAQIAMLVARRWCDRVSARNSKSVAQVMQYYTRRTYVQLALAETTVIMGFCLFMAGGDVRSLLLFGLLGLFYYAQCYPSETGLALRAHPMPTLTKQL